MDIFEKNKVDKSIFGMYLLDNFPVFRYSDVQDSLNIALIGNSIITLDFFKIVVSACHIIEKSLNVTLISEETEEFINEFLKNNPMAKDTFSIQKIDNEGNVTFLSDAKGKYAYAVKNNGPLVNVYVSNKKVKSAKDFEFIDNIIYPEKNNSLFKYVWVVGMDSDKNEKIGKYVENYHDKAEFYKTSRCKSFVGEINNGKGQLITSSIKKQRISHYILSLDVGTSEINSFQNNLKEMAFNIHRFYAKEYNSRQSIQDMKKDFKKAYQMASSMRSAVTIPYKLVSVLDKLPEVIDKDIIYEFCRIVFEENKDSYKEKLVYLEHKSWMLWLICNGWKLPTLDEIRKYAFINGNDFKDKRNKMHPCLIECYKDGPMELENLADKEWDAKNRLNNTKDPLDKVSVKLYLYARERTKEICQDGELTDIISKISKYLIEPYSNEQNQNYKMEYIHNLENAFRKMAELEKNAVNHFDNCINDFKEQFKAELTTDQRLDNELKKLTSLARIIKEASYHKSYKKSDLTIIKAIPYLLNANKVHCIYKLVSDNKSWQNLLSTILIEPQKVVLIYEGWSFEKIIEERKKYDRILNSMGLGHIHIAFISIDDAISKGMFKKITSNDTVDVTGANAKLAVMLLGTHKFEKCQFIIVDGMEIKNLTTGSSEKYLYPVQKSLSVAETLELSDAYYFSESNVNDMAPFSMTYKKIWNIYYNSTIDGGDLNKIRAFMEHINKFSRKEVRLRATVSQYKEEINISVNSGILKAYHIDEVLEELKADGVIKKYTMPENANGFIEITSEYLEVKEYIKWILQKSQIGIDHHFKYIKNEFIPERLYPGTFIYDDSCTLFLSKSIHEIGNQKYSYESVEKSLKKLVKHDDSKCLIREAIFNNQGITITVLNQSVKRLLEREGNALEQFTYFSMRENKYDDIKLGVNLAWTTREEFQSHIFDTTNEIDVVATRGMNTYFVSCKQKEIQDEHLTEIRYFADHFGVEGKAILVTSSKVKLKHKNRADKMNVYIISKNMFDENKVSEAFDMILNGASVIEINHYGD